MAGTKAGALKTRDTIKKIYGKDFYSRIGAIGGKKGGKISKRGKAKKC